jgi:hypothetical protein
MRVLKNTRLEKGCVGLENRRPPLDGEPDLTISTGSHIITLMGRTLNKGHMGNVGLNLSKIYDGFFPFSLNEGGIWGWHFRQAVTTSFSTMK